MAAFMNWDEVAKKLSEFRINGGECADHELLTAVHMECERLVLVTSHGEAQADELLMVLLAHDCENQEEPFELELIPELPEGVYQEDDEEEESEHLTYTGPIRDVSTLPNLNDPAIWASATAGMHAGFAAYLTQNRRATDGPPADEAA